MSDAKSRLEERINRIKTTVRLEEPDRVPIFFPTDTWIAGYAGFTVQEISYDYSKMIAAIEKVVQEFSWDSFRPPTSIWPTPVFDCLGQTQFVFSGQDVESDTTFQFVDATHMEASEYGALAEDPFKFIFEVIMPRKLKELNQPYPRNVIALSKASLAFGKYLAFMGANLKRISETYGIPPMFKGMTNTPLDVIADYFRGFKNLMIDLKRYPAEVIAACEALLPLMIKQAFASYGQPVSAFPCVFIPLHLATYLAPRDFEKFYWPTFSRLVGALVDAGLTPFIFLEGLWEPYYDYLKQLPRGRCIGMLEKGEMKKAKEALGGTLCLCGNIPNRLLYYGSEEECVEYTRRLLEDAAPGGGFIICSDKALINPNDARVENLHAITECVYKYGVY